jgi:hypothetical protein
MRAKLLSGLPVIVLASVLAAGCSHETLSSGAQTLNMTYTPSPTGTGRFDRASLIIDRIQVLPADPQEAALYGAERILLKFTPFEANLAATAPVAYSDITLSAGTYVVTRIEFHLVTLVDTDVPTNPATCIDGVAVIDGQQPANVPQVYAFVNPASLRFSVQPGQTQLALTIDVPGLIAEYEAAYTCEYQPCPGCPVDPRPTLTAFDQTAYQNALLANITIQ